MVERNTQRVSGTQLEQIGARRPSLSQVERQALEDVARQEQLATQQIREQQQSIASRSAQIESRRQELGSQEFIRTLGLGGLATRRQSLEQLSGAQAELERQTGQLRQAQQFISQRTGEAELQIRQRISRLRSAGEFDPSLGVIRDIESQLQQSLPQSVREQITQRVSTARPGQTIDFSDLTTPFLSFPQQIRTQDVVFGTVQPGSERLALRRFSSEVQTRLARGEQVPPSTQLLAFGAATGASFLDIARGLGQTVGGISTQAGESVLTRVPTPSMLVSPLATPLAGVTELDLQQARLQEQERLRALGGRLQQQPILGAGLLTAEALALAGPSLALRGLRSVEAARGLPQIESGFIGGRVTIDEGTSLVRSGFQARQRGLFGDRQFIGAAETDIRFIGQQGEDLLFAAGTRGGTSEIVRVLPGGQIRFGSTVPFGAADVGRLRQQGRFFGIESIGATQIPGGRRQIIAGLGGGINVGDVSFIGSQTRVLRPSGGFLVPVEQGAVRSVGVVRDVQRFPDTVFDVGGQALTSQQRASLISQQRILAQQQSVLQQAAFERSIVQQNILRQQAQVRLARSSGGVFGGSNNFFTQVTTTDTTQLTAQQLPTIVGGQQAPGAFTGLGLFETTQQSGVTLQNPLLPRVRNLAQGLTLQQRTSIASASAQILSNLQREKQANIARSGIAQPLTQSRSTILRNIQTSLVAQAQTQRQVQQLRTQTGRIVSTVPAFPQASVRLPRVPVLPVPLPSDRLRLRSALDKLRGGSVDIVVGKEGKSKVKIIGRRLQPNRALKKGLDFISEDISASFKLRRNTKLPRRDTDISPVRVDFGMFRLGKQDPLRIVERAKFRLSSGKEKSQIRRAKKK